MPAAACCEDDKDNVHPDSVAGVPIPVSPMPSVMPTSPAFLLPVLYQIHTDLAPLLHADDPEPENLIAKMKLIPWTA